MKKTLGTLTLSALCLSLIIGCVKNTPSSVPAHTATNTTQSTEISTTDTNRFRVTLPEQTGEVEVVCHNCQAHFKLSQQIRKMSMKGDAIVDCPVCHKNYLKNSTH